LNNTLVGIDLGFRSTGLVEAVPVHTEIGYDVLSFECVKTEKQAAKKGLYVAVDDVQQCQKLYKEVAAFITRCDPTALVVELPTAGAKGARANRGMGIATGVMASVSAAMELPCVWIRPTEGKVALAGKKNASKEDMMGAVRVNWPDVDWPEEKNRLEHIADAAAALMAARDSDIYKLIRGRVE
jgi:Holliday junction resolvasome RuvABC endonuclease subunit